MTKDFFDRTVSSFTASLSPRLDKVKSIQHRTSNREFEVECSMFDVRRSPAPRSNSLGILFTGLAWLVALFANPAPSFAQADPPLRVFIRAGVKTHGPGQHDHPRFLVDWTKLLAERGCKADGTMNFPTATQLDATDVLIIFAADGMKIVGEERARFENFLRRGGGFVVLHDGVVSGDQHEWAKRVQGGAWRWDGDTKTKWFEGDVGEYFVDTTHPITRGAANFDWKDEIYFDLDMAPDAHVLATSFQSVFVIAPQIWTYEKTWDGGSKPYRAFVSLPGHEYVSFNTPHYRAILLRGIAWAGGRKNVDEFCKSEELASLRYPAGGPTAPEKAAAKLNVHPEFAINLVASEPLVEKIISLDWDPQGRLWVAETPEYPNARTINRNDLPINPQRSLHPESFQGQKENRPAHDRISWLEDTDADGRMDKKHVFADFEHGVPGGLELVTSLVLHKDGVIVAQAPDILWIRDTNSDGTADKVEVLYTGFGTGDTHAVINNFRWGLDGWVYSAIGYSAGNPRSGDGSKNFGRVTAGIIRFKPDGSALEQVASGSCNTWGFDFAPDGEAFYTTATCGEHFLHIVMPEKVLARGNIGGIRASAVLPDHQKVFPGVHHTRPPYIQIDWVGMFTASAGSCVYNGGAWPERFNGSHFSSEPTVNLVHLDFLKPKDATFVASKESGREESEFIAGTDLWFRPIHTRVGPDGALYVVDFYNQAAIHNDTRGPRHGAHNAATRPDRDHHFARIWRVQHKEAKKLGDSRFLQAEALVANLTHANGWVRETSARLLREKGAGAAAVPLALMVKAGNVDAAARVAALHTANYLGLADDATLIGAANDKHPIVRKNALRILADRDGNSGTDKLSAIKSHLNDADARVRIQALMALGTFEPSAEIAQAVLDAWPSLEDGWLQSAAIGVAAKDPLLFAEAALAANRAAAHESFVRHVVRQIGLRGDATQAAKLIALLAKAPASSDGPKQIALESLAANLKADAAPDWSADLQTAFQSLLASPTPEVSGAALPLIGRWDKAGAMGADLKPFVARLAAKLSDASLSDEARGQVAINLLGVRQMDPSIVATVAGMLGSSISAATQRRLAEALGAASDAATGRSLIGASTKVSGELREAVLAELLKRAEWTRALVQALADGQIPIRAFGPSDTHRLRTHPDKAIAKFANETIDALRGPEQKEKEALIAKFKPEVDKPGNLENGRKVFALNCAGCHVFKNEGRDLAPNLTGMGAHGASELLVHLLDPNRLVEPNFVSFSIETRDELAYDGVIARENQRELVLRNASGDYTLQQRDIKSRRSTNLSLMPEGFETLGAEGLRDLLAYICSGDEKYRFIDLRPACTADSGKGIYANRESWRESLRFRKFGVVKAGEVPFEIVAPAKTLNGNNLVVLKGRNGITREYPQRVEVGNLNLKASRLHFLGGVGGWAWPYGGAETKGMPVAKITVTHADGQSESWTLANGVHVVDYINSTHECPESKQVPDLLTGGQVRTFSREIKNPAPIQKIALESFNNAVAPTFVAITAEIPEGLAHAKR
ncbi:MAG: ThuA domain-containing protein [Verrucomicrobia bacterium]|nr:ThuA domain-containing protein [Verrucomicrobiota bacterium]